MAEEKQFNPFMRVHESTIAESVGKQGATPVEVMGALRTAKDNF